MERLDGLTAAPPSPSARAAGPVLAAVVAGLMFAPVFGLTPLLLPVGVPALAVLAVTMLCGRRPMLVDVRPLLSGLAGLLAISETVLFGTTLAGLPTGRTVAALGQGLTDSWRFVLESTWPARADPELVTFVPLLVTVAAVFGTEILLRTRAPLAALLPSLAVLALSQLYAASAPGPAVLGALAYAVAAGLTLATRGGLLRLVAAGAVSVLVAGLTLLLLPDRPARFSAQDGRITPFEDAPLINPLDEIAERLKYPGLEVFRVRTDADVDRWAMVVLDRYDGVTWTADVNYRRFGRSVPPGPEVTAPVERRTARITSLGTGGPWLPSQTWPASVTGVAPLLNPRYGSIALKGSDGAATYELSWWQPEVTSLSDAALDTTVPGLNEPVGEVPGRVQLLAEQVTRNLRPSFESALLLERFLKVNYRAAVGEDLPSGHSWGAVEEFLFESKRGTSEQFAAAYVGMARVLGIPARLAVGFRKPAPAVPGPDGSVVIRNRDVLAWPEVAVRGVGWVPLDPIKSAAGAATPAGGDGLAAKAEEARRALPPERDLSRPEAGPAAPGSPSPVAPGEVAAEQTAVPWAAMLLAVPLVPLIGWPLGVPAAWTLRSWRRRRRTGPAAVLGAWSEVRDRLRAYGVTVTPGMTVRDLGRAAGEPVGDDLGTLARVVDRALWSGSGPSDQDIATAWSSVDAVRRGLARRGRAARAWALLNPWPLLPSRITRRTPRP